MRKWNPHNITVTNEWVEKFAKKNRLPNWYARVCLNFGLFLTHIEYLITGKIKG